MRYPKLFTAACLAAVLGVATPFVSARAATYTAQERADIKLVADFYAALDRGDAHHDLKQKIRGIAERYLSSDYMQHNEIMRAYGPGREGFIRLFESMPSAPPGPPGAAAPPPAKLLAMMAHGDLVIRVSSRSMPKPGGNGVSSGYIFNMFRVKDGKLAEHWDASSGTMMMPSGKGGGPQLPPGPPKS